MRNDGLGRLVEVKEFDGAAYTTSYGYDLLDNLLSVNQGGQLRKKRDSLTRPTDIFREKTRDGSTITSYAKTIENRSA